jgi:mRNA interferase MazF
MLRGEVWWAALPKPYGARPVLLLSRDKALQVRDVATVAPVTSTIRNIPVEVPLDADDGMPKACVVNVDTLMTIDKSLLQRRICALRPDKLAAAAKAVKYALALD